MQQHDIIAKLGQLLPHQSKPLEHMCLRLLLNLSTDKGEPTRIQQISRELSHCKQASGSEWWTSASCHASPTCSPTKAYVAADFISSAGQLTMG